MIRVSFSSNRDERKATLRLKGHAGQAEIGKDLICASASILAYTLAQIILAMEHHGDLIEPPTIKLDSGNAIVECRAKDDDLYAEVLHTYFVVKTGYRLLNHNYPKYVELIDD